MTAETILTVLVRINVVASVAIVLVLALRPWALRALSGRVAYWLWFVVPIAVLASVLPAREQAAVVPGPAVVTASPENARSDVSVSTPIVPAATRPAAPPPAFVPALADALLVAWLFGATLLLARSIIGTRRLAADPSVGPALVGVFRPKLVLPADFSTRFDTRERALILAHEETHRVSGHTVVNALVELVRCASWFNPLVHFGATRLRVDQELACDAAVIAARPGERRAYAQALLKTQVGAAFLPLGCTWTSRTAQRMAERIELVGRASLGRRGKLGGAFAVAIVGAVLGYAAWAQQPSRIVPPEAVFTPSAGAPAGLLTALAADRHDRAIRRAEAGDIDFVFFGTTDTEMWSWSDRGRAVWNEAFGSMKSANFGSQGTSYQVLAWRMQNGELAGYAAKLVILQDMGPIEAAIKPTDAGNVVASHAALVAEIRARQPQAKILIVGRFPRGQVPLAAWREIAATRAAVFRELADDKTVFYTDIGERFFNSDGSFKREMWGSPSAGMQGPAFEVWAEELQPWLDRFVR